MSAGQIIYACTFKFLEFAEICNVFVTELGYNRMVVSAASIEETPVVIFAALSATINGLKDVIPVLDIVYTLPEIPAALAVCVSHAPLV